MAITIKKVSTKKELKQFIRFNYKLYKNNPYSVPDLYDDMLNTFNKKKNAAFEFCEADYFLAYKDDRINRIMDIYKLSEKEAVDKIKKIDRERRLYYEGRTDRKWGSIEANAILLNSSLLGIDGAVDALEAIYHKWENR